MSKGTVDKRLHIIEGVLGIDPLDIERCQANHLECLKGCPETSCPLEDNGLRRVQLEVSDLLQEHLQIRCWAQGLEECGHVPEGTWDKAVSRARVIWLEERLQRLKNRLTPDIPEPLLGRIQKSIVTLEHQIQEEQEKPC